MLGLQEPISGRYRLQQRLRRGGMSDVYLAYDERLNRDVALKLVSSNDTECIQRLHHEVEVMSKLTHDHILPTLDYGECGSYHYLVMPYMKQGTLRERIAEGSLTEEEVSNIFAQVASSLQYAHDHGIIHRDIKPSNILLDDDDKQYVYLADFGLAKVMGEGSDLTQTGCLIGTPEYMAPELAHWPESVSSDIYALGVLLYHMLTRRPPFTGGTPLSVYWKHLRELPIPPTHLNPDISHPMEQVILRALNKEPHRRYPSVIAMAQAYANALKTPEQTGTLVKEQTFVPALIALHKMDSNTLPAAVRQALPWWQSPRHKIQKAIVSLVTIILIATPLSLGFLLSRIGAQNAMTVSASTQFAINTQQTHLLSSPQSTPVVHGSSGDANIQQVALPMPQHKHKHKHKHRHESENGDDD